MPKFITKYGEVEFATVEQYESFLKLSGDASHETFMEGKEPFAHVIQNSEGKAEFDERSARQEMRRSKMLNSEFASVPLVRASPGSSPEIEYISFDVWAGLVKDYKSAIDSGESANSALRRVGFQPLSNYAGKLMSTRPDGRIRKIRDVLVNEVGIRPNGKIVLLQDRMPGDVGTVVVGAHRMSEAARKENDE